MTYNSRISELAEVQSVTAAQPAQIGTKRVDEKGFFDVSTVIALRAKRDKCPELKSIRILIKRISAQLSSEF